MQSVEFGRKREEVGYMESFWTIRCEYFGLFGVIHKLTKKLR